MRARETFIAVINVLRTLQDAQLLYFYQLPVLSRTGNVEMVSWPNAYADSGYSDDTTFASLVQYRRSLLESSYLAILRDGTIIKGFYAFKHNKLVKHSLWYWPCPFAIPDEDIMQETPLGALELYSNSWEKYVRFRTPMRFDYHPEAAKDGHPASHLHMQSPECRIAVERPLGFASFVRFVFRNFHQEYWEQTDIWNDLTDELDDKEKSCLAKSDIWLQHIGWKRPL